MRLIAASVLVALVLSGCATTSGTYSGYDTCARIDCQKMADVDRQARVNGLDVYWVHPPERPTATR
jgi:hypothetical protein